MEERVRWKKGQRVRYIHAEPTKFLNTSQVIQFGDVGTVREDEVNLPGIVFDSGIFCCLDDRKLEPIDFVVKDSGTRQEFASGMVRDTATNKIDYELVFNGPMLKRWAEHLTKGATKYPDPEPGRANWTRATGAEEQVRFRKSAVRHFIQWLNGDTDEDHAAAVFFNINGYEYVKGKETHAAI